MSSPKTSGKSIASLILGISSFLCMLFTGIPAIIFGTLALGDIKKSKKVTGSGLAIAGIVTGALGCLWSFVVIVLILLLLPAVQQVREVARTTVSLDNLRNLVLAMHNYHDTFADLPSVFPDPENKTSQLSWRVQILPYLEQLPLYEQFHHDEPWDSPHNLTLIDQMPAVFASVSHELEPGKTMYVVPTTITASPDKRDSAIFVAGQRAGFNTILDGMSNTIMIVEVDPDAAVTWTKPDDLVFDPENPLKSLGNARLGLFIAAFADGSVRRIKTDIPPEQLKALFTAQANDIAPRTLD